MFKHQKSKSYKPEESENKKSSMVELLQDQLSSQGIIIWIRRLKWNTTSY
jgi:hypothetical protein